MSDLKIIGVYDNEKTIDRYTIVFNEENYSYGNNFYTCLALSSYPESPQGFSQVSSCQVGDHLGKKIHFYSLPKNVQEHIIMRMKEN